MRIELNYGGLFSGTSVKDFQKKIKTLIKKSDNTIDGFKKIKTFAYNMNGGVGCLQDAVDQIDVRINAEETKKGNLIDVQNKVDTFLENTRRTDKEVGALVKKNKNEFYKLHPWAKPTIKDTVKNWIEKVNKFLCKLTNAVNGMLDEKFEEFTKKVKAKVEKIVEIGKSTWDTIKKGYDSVVNATKKFVDFVIENKDFIRQVAIEIAIGAAVIGLAALTGGTSLVLTVAIGAGVSAVISGVAGGAEYYAEHGTLEGAAKDIIGSASKGFMTGSISSYIGGQAGMLTKGWGKLSTVAFKATAGSVASAGGETLHSVTDFNGISEEEGRNIIKSGVSGFISSGVYGYKGYGKETFIDKFNNNKISTQNKITNIKNNLISDMKVGKEGCVINASDLKKQALSVEKHTTKKLILNEIKDKTISGVKKKIKSEVKDNVIDYVTDNSYNGIRNVIFVNNRQVVAS